MPYQEEALPYQEEEALPYTEEETNRLPPEEASPYILPEQEVPHILPEVPTPEEYAWHEQEEEVARQNSSEVCQTPCKFGTTQYAGECQNTLDGVCYPYTSPACAKVDPSIRADQECCPGGSVDCSNQNETFKSYTKSMFPNYIGCFLLPLIVIIIVIFWQRIF